MSPTYDECYYRPSEYFSVLYMGIFLAGLVGFSKHRKSKVKLCIRSHCLYVLEIACPSTAYAELSIWTKKTGPMESTDGQSDTLYTVHDLYRL